jgi:hypothetical protein
MPLNKGPYFTQNVAIPAPPPVYLKGHKIPRVSSGIDQSFQIDLLKRSVNTDAQFSYE